MFSIFSSPSKAMVKESMKNLSYNDENIIEHSYTIQEKNDDRKNQRNSREK